MLNSLLLLLFAKHHVLRQMSPGASCLLWQVLFVWKMRRVFYILFSIKNLEVSKLTRIFSCPALVSHMLFLNKDFFFLLNVKFKTPNPPLNSISNIEQVTLRGVCWRRGACVCFDKGTAFLSPVPSLSEWIPGVFSKPTNCLSWREESNSR